MTHHRALILALGLSLTSSASVLALGPGSPEGGLVPRGVIGPDVSFCQLYGLKQFGRLGDVAGLALATTSWNVGDEDAMWFDIPGEEHPFIVSNLYRIKNDRFEQIGQSWIKHGFFALGNEQCGGNCTYEPGHGAGNWLGTGCTDTYDANLNASQDGLGPRYEVNPWTGAWNYPGSHIDSYDSPTDPPHQGLSPIAHRLQVHDADIDPAQNAGATYIAEAYYVLVDDVEPLNSASWKTVTFTGAPGGTWTVSMSGATVPPTIGFALDAWTGSTQTTFAQDNPPVKFESPDGRCVVAAKTTDLGGGMWHYEYAVLNMDMDRKAGSFSIPIAEGALITNIGFHAVESHDEPYANSPWVSTRNADSIVWSTDENPLRWGTVYNFRFDANASPITTTATLGLYESGTPAELSNSITGPSLAAPDCNNNGNPDVLDTSSGSSEDCNGNTTPDECEFAIEGDCNANGALDACDIQSGASGDCNTDAIPDDCQLAGNDCNSNLAPDECDPRTVLAVEDDVENTSGWTVVNESVTTGAWEVADPEQTLSSSTVVQPEDDNTPDGTLCFVTDGTAGSAAGTFDIDGGPTRLISPTYDLSAGVATLEYAYWLYSDDGDDVLNVDVSVDDGANWIPLIAHGESLSGWRTSSLDINAVVRTTSETRLRFSAADQPNNSIAEAALDDITVIVVDCTPPPEGCEADVNGDGLVDPLDYGYVLARFGCQVGTGDTDCDAADANVDGLVDPLDGGYVQARFGTCE